MKQDQNAQQFSLPAPGCVELGEDDTNCGQQEELVISAPVDSQTLAKEIQEDTRESETAGDVNNVKKEPLHRQDASETQELLLLLQTDAEEAPSVQMTQVCGPTGQPTLQPPQPRQVDGRAARKPVALKLSLGAVQESLSLATPSGVQRCPISPGSIRRRDLPLIGAMTSMFSLDDGEAQEHGKPSCSRSSSLTRGYDALDVKIFSMQTPRLPATAAQNHGEHQRQQVAMARNPSSSAFSMDLGGDAPVSRLGAQSTGNVHSSIVRSSSVGTLAAVKVSKKKAAAFVAPGPSSMSGSLAWCTQKGRSKDTSLSSAMVA